MYESSLEMLQLRLKNLEKQNRQMRMCAWLIFSFIGFGILSGATYSNKFPKVIKAQRFELVNNAGKTLATLNLDDPLDSHSPMLAFFDDKGNIVSHLTANDLSFMDDHGQSRLQIASLRGFPKLSPSITLTHNRTEDNTSSSFFISATDLTISSGKPSAMPKIILGKNASMEEIKALKDWSEKGFKDEKLLIGLDAQDQPFLRMNDINGKGRLSVTSTDFTIWDENEKPRLSIGNLSLTNPETGGKQETGLASLVMFNNRGDILWQAPPYTRFR